MAKAVTTAFAGMDSNGMFPAEWACRSCGRRLNDDGQHPAELYAGTFTGLCYTCTASEPFRVKTYRDGCEVWSHPPHCPSWRRDRQSFLFYPGCPECDPVGRRTNDGWPIHKASHGRIRVSRPDAYGGDYVRQCGSCAERYCSEPLRARYWRHTQIVSDAMYARAHREVTRLRRQLKLRKDDPLPPEQWAPIQESIVSQVARARFAIERWAERRAVFGVATSCERVA